MIPASPSPPPPPPPAYVDVQASYSHESLTNGRKSWDARALRFTKQRSGRTLYVEVSSNSRFGERDNQVLAGAYLPVGERWMAMAEAGAASPHGVLPSQMLFGGVQYASGANWYEGLGARHASYATASVNSAIATLEHYWRNNRFSYTLTAADVAGEGTDVEHAVELDRYYGAQSSYIGIGYLSGREVDAAGPSLLLSSRVRGWSASGRHWMNRNWGIVYGIETFDQGNLYSRKGGRVGLDYRF